MAVFLDFGEKGIIVVWIMVGQDQFLDSGKPGALDGLLVAGMAPTAVVGQLLRGELCIMEQEIGPAAEFDRGRVQIFAVLNIEANHDRFLAPDDPIAVGTAGMLMFSGGHDGLRIEKYVRVGE